PVDASAFAHQDQIANDQAAGVFADNAVAVARANNRLSLSVGSDDNRRGRRGGAVHPQRQASIKRIAAAKQQPVSRLIGLPVRSSDGPRGAIRAGPIPCVVTTGADMEFVAARGWRHPEKKERETPR